MSEAFLHPDLDLHIHAGPYCGFSSLRFTVSALARLLLRPTASDLRYLLGSVWRPTLRVRFKFRIFYWRCIASPILLNLIVFLSRVRTVLMTLKTMILSFVTFVVQGSWFTNCPMKQEGPRSRAVSLVWGMCGMPHTYACMYVCMYICMYVRMYVYT